MITQHCKLPLIGLVYTPLKGVFTKVSIRGGSYLPEQKKSLERTCKIRFVFNGYEAAGAPNENIVQNHLNI